MSELFTPKQRMLNAYRGIASDRYPVAPEFWYYYPAKVLGVPMVQYEREIPLWQALQVVFKKYACEGWGAVFPNIKLARGKTEVRFEKMGEDCYKETTITEYCGKQYTTVKRYSAAEPSWVQKHIASNSAELMEIVGMMLDPDNEPLVSRMTEAHRGVGEDYLLEAWLGVPFFDFIADIIGFEQAIMFFFEEDPQRLEDIRARYTAYQINLVDQLCEKTPFESYVIGCSYSCNSVIGPDMWRRWDKPYIQAIAERLHQNGKLLHIHFHGKSMETVEDFPELGVDCVCPFERSPGGDVNTLEDLKYVRHALNDRVTFNGNVHTVETLIRGNAEQVRQEVRQIKQAFQGSNRLIIGTGDQVGYETKEENILAMIDEAKKSE